VFPLVSLAVNAGASVPTARGIMNLSCFAIVDALEILH
jgi:hypothetical protein